MFDCSSELKKFHDDMVQLPEPIQAQLRAHRDVNRDRVRRGLEAKGKPTPIDYLIQGSYDMETIIQQPNNDYDIDDGVVFRSEDLKGPQGGKLEPLDVRQMIHEAVQDSRFKKAPELHHNCVRVFYQEGHHVDIPAYREVTNLFAQKELELASSEWKKSNPKAVTEWFNEQVKTKSPDESGDKQQLRRTVRLLKRFARSRDSWNMPSGLILSVLISAKYSPQQNRDDISFYETIRAIRLSLDWSLSVRHPVLQESLTKTDSDASMVELRTRLGEALENLKILNDSGCTRKIALQAWGKVFNIDFLNGDFDKRGPGPTTFTITGKPPELPVRKEGGGRYG